MSEENIIKTFRDELIKELKRESELEIEKQTKDFENRLRELSSAKIVSFVDTLKIIVKQETNGFEPKMIIEVHL